MRLFLDTNIFVATVTDEPEFGVVATELLNTDHELLTSTLNLMEVRTVLTKKNRLDDFIHFERVIESLAHV